MVTGIEMRWISTRAKPIAIGAAAPTAFFAVVPLLIFAVPLFDTISVVVIRLEARRSPFVGDTNHFSHRLVRLGMTRRQAVLTIYLVTFTIGLGATILYQATTIGCIVVSIQALALFGIIILLEMAGRRNRAEKSGGQ